jgi:hypothetical protein
MTIPYRLAAGVLAALLLSACNGPLVVSTPLPPAPSTDGDQAAASPTAPPADTPAPSASSAPTSTSTLAATQTAETSLTPTHTAAPTDTPLPPTPTEPGQIPTATEPAASPTVAGATALPDTAVPPTDNPQPTASLTPFPPDSTQSPGQTYVVYSEQALGEFVARVWVRADYPFPDMLSLGTIDRGTERLVQITDVAGFAPLPAADVTGEGQLDVAFALRWGGSHCCWGTVLYNLGETPQQVLWVGGEIGVGTFTNLDSDGDWEFVTHDVVIGLPCSRPSPLAVLAYSPAQGYAPASPQYPAAYEAEIAELTAQAEQRLQANGVMAQCDVSDLMLDYLYSGQAERGWAEFARLYTAPDAADFRAALEKAAAQGQLYVAAGP